MNTLVSVLMPALNEEQHIATAIAKAQMIRKHTQAVK